MAKHNKKALLKKMTSTKDIVIPRTLARKIRHFDAGAFLAHAGLGRTIVELKKNQNVFSQGDPADAVFYIQTGRVRLTVVSSGGKEAVVALLGTKDFMGEECIANSQPQRMVTATAITDGTVLK